LFSTSTLVVGTISALTLAWTIIWSVSTRRLKTRPQLKVRSTWAFLTYGPEVGPLCIQTTAANTGLAPVTVDSCSMLVGSKRGSRVAIIEWVNQNPQPLPVRLEPGEHWTGLAHADSIKVGLDHHLGRRRRWRVRPLVGDPAGRSYKARLAGRGWRRLFTWRRHWLALT
jgi:hypothetical protein